MSNPAAVAVDPRLGVSESRSEETLDPEDWDAVRTLGHRMVDDVLDYLSTVRDRPTWQRPPEDGRARLRPPLPREAEGAERAYQQFLGNVRPNPRATIHPASWGV